MTDLAFAMALPAVLVVVAAAYGVRRLRLGDAHFSRVDRIGGSALVGKRWLEMGYWAIQPVARLCMAMGLSANALTWISLILGGLAGAALARGHFGAAALLSVASSLCDALDGSVARQTGSDSDAGEVLDASVDRYTELFFAAGLVVHYAAWPRGLLLVLSALAGSFMVSYSTAKAEALQVKPPRGLMRRHERVLFLVFGAAATSVLSHATWAASWFDLPMLGALAIVALAANASAIYRLGCTARAVRRRERALAEATAAGAGAPGDGDAYRSGGA